MDAMYADEILDHYKHPRNQGELPDADVRVDANNPLCGDKLHMDLKLIDGIVEDVRFSGRGCAISQASASMLTEEMPGKSLEELARLKRDDILEMLGIEVSYARMKCALLSLGLLRSALVEAGVPVSKYIEDDEA